VRPRRGRGAAARARPPCRWPAAGAYRMARPAARSCKPECRTPRRTHPPVAARILDFACPHDPSRPDPVAEPDRGEALRLAGGGREQCCRGPHPSSSRQAGTGHDPDRPWDRLSPRRRTVMPSISKRLFLILVLTTGLVWLSAVVWIFLSTRAEVERVLDARLMEAGRMVSSLIVNQEIAVDPNQTVTAEVPTREHSSYERQLSCQIWSLQGTLIGRSEDAPNEALAEHADGISETVIDGERWRVYAVTNADLGVRVLVGDNLKIRDGLVNDVIRGLLLPAMLILPLLAGLIWLSVRKGLAPLNKVAHDLEARHASDLSPIDNVETAREIVPVLQSLNGLFARVAGLRERERNFTT